MFAWADIDKQLLTFSDSFCVNIRFIFMRGVVRSEACIVSNQGELSMWKDFVRWLLLQQTARSLLTLPRPRKPLRRFSDWLSKCARTPGVTFIRSLLRSCDILTMLWQHDENVMLERSVSAVSHSVWRPFFVCVRQFPPTKMGGVDDVLWLIYLVRAFLLRAATWSRNSKLEVCFNAYTANQIGFLGD